MEAIIVNGRVIAVTGTRSQVRRAFIDKRGTIRRRPVDITGIKRVAVNIGGYEARTPYGNKEIARRRAANKVAKQSRKRNR